MSASSSSSASTNELLRDAREHLSRNEYTEALSVCKRILAADAKNYFALVFAGKAGHALGRHAQAVAPYRAAIAIAPTNATAYFGLLQVHVAMKDAEAVRRLCADFQTGPIRSDALATAKRRTVAVFFALSHVWTNETAEAMRLLDEIVNETNSNSDSIDDVMSRALPLPVLDSADSDLTSVQLAEDATRFELAALAARLHSRLDLSDDAESRRFEARLRAVADLALPRTGRGDAWLAESIRRRLRRRDAANELELRAFCAQIASDIDRPLVADAVTALLTLDERAGAGELHTLTTPPATLALLLNVTHSVPQSPIGRLGVALAMCEQLEAQCDAGLQVLAHDHPTILAPSPANPLDAAQRAAQVVELALFDTLQAPSVRGALARPVDVPLLLAAVPARHCLLIGAAAEALRLVRALQATLEARALAPPSAQHWSGSLAMLEARAHTQLRNFGAAQQCLRSVSANCVHFRDEAQVQLAELVARDGDSAAALALCDEVLARSPSAWRARGLRGWLSKTLADVDVAASAAPAADFRPHFWRGDVLLSGENAADAGAPLLRSAELNRNYAPTFNALGRYYRDALNDDARARRCFAQAIKLDASLREAADALAQLFVAAGSLALAADVYADAAARDSSLLWAYEQHAVHLLQCVHDIDVRSDVDEPERQRAARWTNDALVSLQQAVRIDDKRALVWQVLSSTYARQGKYSAAIKAARRALELDASALVPHLLLAQLHLDVGDVANAATTFASAGESPPARIGAADAWLRVSVAHQLGASRGLAADSRNKARAALRTLEKDGSLASVTRALQLDGDAALLDALNERDAQARKATMQHAVAQRVALVRRQPSSAWSLVLLGHALLLASTHDSAAGAETNATRAKRSRESFLRALRLAASVEKPDASLAPLLAALWTALGVSCAESPLIAQHCLVHALRMDQRNVVAWTNLGFLFASRQRLGLASDALERACALKPSFAPAWVASAVVRELLASRLIARARRNEALVEWRSALHAYLRATDAAVADTLTGAMSDASASASSVTSATGVGAALRIAHVGVAACSLAMRRMGDKSVDMDRALLAAQQAAADEPDSIDVLNVLGACYAARGQHGNALAAFERALTLLGNATSQSSDELDLQRSLLPSVASIGSAQRFAVLVHNAVVAACRVRQFARVLELARVGAKLDAAALLAQVDIATACRVAQALVRVGRGGDALALVKHMRNAIAGGGGASIRTLTGPATAPERARALLTLSTVCTVAENGAEGRECVSLCCQLFPSDAAAWRLLATHAALANDRDTALFVLSNADYVSSAAKEGPERAVREAQLLSVLGEHARARALIVRAVHERPDVGALWQEMWSDGTHTLDSGVDAVASDVDLALSCRAGVLNSARVDWWAGDELANALLRLGATEGLSADVAHAHAASLLERRVRDSGSWALVSGDVVLALAVALRALAALEPSDVQRWRKLDATLGAWRAVKRSTGSAVGDARLRLLAVECALFDGDAQRTLDVAECVAIEQAALLPVAAVARVRALTECALAQRAGKSVADVLRAAIRRQPHVCELWLMLGEHYAANGQVAGAVVCAQTALTVPNLELRERNHIQLRLTLHLLNARSYELAVEAASEATRLAPRSVAAHLLRAVALLRAGADASLIVGALQSCLLLDQEEHLARYLLAFVLMQLDDLSRALAHGERLLAARPDMARANHVVARVLMAQAGAAKIEASVRTKLLKRADHLLRKAVQLDANVPDFAKDLAKIEKIAKGK
jgi:tetratricopeptide (TPR) repeat protein